MNDRNKGSHSFESNKVVFTLVELLSMHMTHVI